VNSRVNNRGAHAPGTIAEATAADMPANKRYIALPHNLPPLGLRREAAAAFVCMSPSKFDQLVADGRMPKPKHIDGIVQWPVERLKEAYNALPDDSTESDWYDS
jgi:predicted DNA-binding transcriptional regulator AlpA